MPDELVHRVQLPLVWVGIEDLPVVVVNQILSHIVEADEIVVVLGHASPPTIIGTPEQQAEQLEDVPFVEVRPVARFGLTSKRLGEVIHVLQDVQAKHEQLVREQKGLEL